MKKELVILMLILAFGYSSNAIGICLNIKGTIKVDQVVSNQAAIEIIKNEHKIAELLTDEKGKFSINLEADNNYTLVVSKDGYFQQKIAFNTHLDDDDLYLWKYKFTLDLIPFIQHINTNISETAIATISYNPNSDEFESKTNSQLVAELKKLKSQPNSFDKTYKALIEQADIAFSTHNYPNATLLYEKATVLNHTDNYPDIQLASIKHITAQNKRIDAKYVKYINLADEHYRLKEYDRAKKRYKKAIKLKSDDYPLEQLSRIEKIVPLKDILSNL